MLTPFELQIEIEIKNKKFSFLFVNLMNLKLQETKILEKILK